MLQFYNKEYRLPNKEVKAHRDLAGVAEGKADQARINRSSADDGKESCEEYDDVAQHLQTNCQPPVTVGQFL